MMKTMKLIAALVLSCGLSGGWHSVFAEYQMDAGDKMEKNAQGEMVLIRNPNSDEIDREACQVITDNINELAKYDIDWECGIPISANQYLLSKPAWVEATGEERNRAIIAKYKTMPGYGKIPDDDPRFKSYISQDARPVYGYSFNVDKTEAAEKIYSQSDDLEKINCTKGFMHSRTHFWFAEADGSSLLPRVGDESNLTMSNHDYMLYKNHFYFVGYNQGSEKDVFFVSKLKIFPESQAKMGAFRTFCEIRQDNPMKK